METNRLQYFVTLASEGSFMRASESLYISQPGLSQQIKKLESELGCILIDRRIRPWELTPVGRAVFERAKEILNGVQGLKPLLHDAQAGEIGRLRVGIVPTALYGRFPGMLRKYKRQHPQVSITTETFNTRTLIGLLRHSRLDVAVLLSDLRDDTLTSLPLYSQEVLVALPKDHALADRPSIRLRQLRTEEFCMTPRGNASVNHDQIIAACVQEGFSPQISAETGTYAEQVGLVASGAGVAIVPQELSGLHPDDVVFKPSNGWSIRVLTTLVWRRDNSNAACATFARSYARLVEDGGLRLAEVGYAPAPVSRD